MVVGLQNILWMVKSIDYREPYMIDFNSFFFIQRIHF